jgi:hypothetical protein
MDTKYIHRGTAIGNTNICYNCIGCVMGSLLTLSVVYCGFETQSCQVKDYDIGICCFSVTHSVLG